MSHGSFFLFYKEVDLMKMQRWRRSARQIDENNQNMIVTDTPTQI